MKSELQEKAMIFDVEYFGTKDGPGIRTVLFFKGCDLACQWCHNPESQKFNRQVLYYASKCIGCDRCIAHCPVQAIKKDEKFGYVTDYAACIQCGLCASVCSFNARVLVGKQMDLSEIQEIILKDKDFFIASNGGVTLTGGEPMLQRQALASLVEWLSVMHIHTALETAGNYPVEQLQALLPNIDLVFIDFKHIDEEKHKKFTGVSNQKSLKTLSYLATARPDKTIIRIPIIPGFNDDEKSYCAMFEHLQTLQCKAPIELLPFHNLGGAKYDAIARHDAYKGVASLHPQDLQTILEEGLRRYLTVRIGSI